MRSNNCNPALESIIGIEPISHLPGAVQSELSIKIKNGVATLSGCVCSHADALLAEQLVSRMSNVEHVINLITD